MSNSFLNIIRQRHGFVNKYTPCINKHAISFAKEQKHVNGSCRDVDVNNQASISQVIY